MRILMLGDARTEHVARWAAHFRGRGDAVWVASAQPGPGVDVPLRLMLPWQGLAYPLLVPLLRKIIARLKPDLLVGHYLPNYGLLTVLSGFRPHVVVGWGSDLLSLPGRGMIQRSRLRLVATRGDAFVVDARMLVAPLTALGARSEAIHVVPFGVDEDVLLVGECTERLGRETPRLVCNRRHEPSYHMETFVHAIAELAREGHAFHACIANGGSQTPALRRLADDAGVSDRIDWAGHLDRVHYVASLRDADVYVSTSPSDSTSVSMLEAMAAGLPAVVPDIPGNREWIEDGRSGLLYQPLDSGALAGSLRPLLSDAARRVELGRAGRTVIGNRGRWRDTIQVAESLFERLTGG